MQPEAPPRSLPPTGPAYDNQRSPVELLASYYDAIEHQEYRRAYGYWETPPSDYDDFVRGYADTASAQLIVEPPTRIEGAAGSLYAAIPTVLVATHHDGSAHTFAGCYFVRGSNVDSQDRDWRLYRATIGPAAPGAISAQLGRACAP